MDKGRTGHVTIMITIIILAAVFLVIVFTSINRNRPQIVLPEEIGISGVQQNGGENGSANEVLKVEVTPETVQNVIATLNRPSAYARIMAITTFWSGGDGTITVNAYTLSDLVRMDMILPSGQTKHIVQTEDAVYIWYNQERTVYTDSRGALNADDEQWIPTYEDLLALDANRICEAGYQSYQEVECIYAATAADEEGYSERYWVSVHSGLLVAAERLQEETVVYRMEELSVTLGEPDGDMYTLPNGKKLYSEDAA